MRCIVLQCFPVFSRLGQFGLTNWTLQIEIYKIFCKEGQSFSTHTRLRVSGRAVLLVWSTRKNVLVHHYHLSCPHVIGCFPFIISGIAILAKAQISNRNLDPVRWFHLLEFISILYGNCFVDITVLTVASHRNRKRNDAFLSHWQHW